MKQFTVLSIQELCDLAVDYAFSSFNEKKNTKEEVKKRNEHIIEFLEYVKKRTLNE